VRESTRGGLLVRRDHETEVVAVFLDHLGEDLRRQRCEAKGRDGRDPGLGRWGRDMPAARGCCQVRPGYCSVVNAFIVLSPSPAGWVPRRDPAFWDAFSSRRNQLVEIPLGDEFDAFDDPVYH
jgi:hypothetical protein